MNLNQLDPNEFNKLISELDNEIGIDSSAHKDTLMAMSLIVLRGKELRMNARHISMDSRYEYTREYIVKKCPRAQFDLLKWSLFREGIIHCDYLEIIKTWTTIIVFLMLSTISVFVFAINSQSVILLSLCWCAISAFIASLFYCIVDSWAESRCSSYFGLGHRKK